VVVARRVNSTVRRFLKAFISEERHLKKTNLWKDASIPLKVVSCIAAILLLACSSGLPSESDGKRFLENQGKKTYKVKTFTKTNGVGTTNSYSLEYEAQVECIEVNVNPPYPTLLQNEFDVACEKVGELKKLTGKIQFNKTEKGWRGEDGEIY
jgi:hypothetical protein